MKANRSILLLAFAFSVLLALLVIVGGWGVVQLAGMNSKVQAMVDRRWQKVQLSREALSYSSLNSRITMQIFLLPDRLETEPLLEQRAGNTEKISALMKTIEAGLETDAEKKLLANIWTNRVAYVNSYKLALDLLLKQGRPEAARTLMSGEVLTNLVAYHNAWEAFVNYQGAQMNQAADAVEARYLAAREELVELVTAASFVAVIIALFVIRKVTRETASRREAQRSLRQANEVLEERVRERTEELTGAHQELRLREERFRKLSQSAPIGIFETDAAGQALFCNPHWLEITGLSLSAAVGNGWQNAVHPEDAARVVATWAACAREGREFDDEFRFRRPTGEDRWVRARSVVLRSESGQITGHAGTVEDITGRRRAAAELATAHAELLEQSRLAGMAEVATDVLHNIGNVLNSVNVSATCVADGLRRSKAANLGKVVALLREHEADLGGFFTHDPKAKLLPGYLVQLARHLAQEQAAAQKELAELQQHIDHIKDIVALQQGCAKVSAAVEPVQVTELLDDALRMNLSGLDQHNVKVVTELEVVPAVMAQKRHLLQILVNLVRNAQRACADSGRDNKQLTLRIRNGGDQVRVSVTDNGVGIRPENLTRIFAHGFSTRQRGPGLGLHSGALAVKDMGGALSVASDGPGRGATFTLELPARPATAHE